MNYIILMLFFCITCFAHAVELVVPGEAIESSKMNAIIEQSNENKSKLDNIATGLIVDSGVVKQTNLPYARASHEGNVSGNNYIPLNVVRGSREIVINGTRMTVSKGGLYLAGYTVLGNSGSGALQMHIRVNGVQIPGTSIQETSSANDSASMIIPLMLNANDYVEFFVNQGASHGNSNFNSFWLVFQG